MKPPYFIFIAICRNSNCGNYGKEFTREKKEATYKSTSGETRRIEQIACPLCRCWSKISKYRHKKLSG